LIPANAQQTGGTFDISCPQDVHCQRFEQVGKATSFIRPWQARLPYAMLRARYARRTGMQVGHELATIQVPPSACGRMVVHSMFLSAFRTDKSHSFRMSNIHINPSSRHIQINTLDPPRFVYPQQVPV
jgi:hypothetical protein